MKYKEGAKPVYGRHWDRLLYEVNNRKDKIMIVFSGSEGGLEHAGKTAKYL